MRLNSVQVIVLIAVVGSALVLGVVGMFRLRYKCKKTAPAQPPEHAGDAEGECRWMLMHQARTNHCFTSQVILHLRE
jgi:hypothetical protein